MSGVKKLWWACPITRYGTPDWKEADGPHEGRSGCEETIAILRRLHCVTPKPYVICEVDIHPCKESTAGVNMDAIETLNSVFPSKQQDTDQ